MFFVINYLADELGALRGLDVDFLAPLALAPFFFAALFAPLTLAPPFFASGVLPASAGAGAAGTGTTGCAGACAQETAHAARQTAANTVRK